MGTNAIISLTESTENLGESVSVDRDNGVIKGVKILGLVSRNGREYLQEAVARAVPLYEGRACYINHRAKPGDSRQVAEAFGEWRQVRVGANGVLVGDLHYLKTHDLAERVCEAAERRLATCGMSHDVKGRVAQRNGKTVVEEITSVASVDLVADPGTTRNLFEQTEPSDMDAAKLQEQVEALKADVIKLSGEKAALQEQLDAKNKEAEESARKAAISALFVEHKVDRSKVGAGLLSIIEGSTVDSATKAVKDLAEQFAKPKSASGTASSASFSEPANARDAARRLRG